MDEKDFTNSMEWQPQPFKPKVTCWGCKKKQSDCEYSFMECSKCNEMKFIKSKFCSQECYVENWPRHKEWHKNQEKTRKSIWKESSCDVKHGKVGSRYERLIEESDMHFKNMELSLAQKKLRKAIKLDPMKPVPYYQMSLIYRLSGMEEEAMLSAEMALSRCASIVIKTKHIRLTHLWATLVCDITEHYLNGALEGRENPTWLVQDELLKRVTKLANEIIQLNPSEDPEYKYKMSYLRASVLSGCCYSDTIAKQLPEPYPPDNRTCDELMEAAVCFRKAGSGELFSDEKNSYCLARSKELSQFARARAARPSEHLEAECSSFKIFPGSWAVIKGLTSEEGLPLNLNQTPALVCGYEEQTGRWIVEVDKKDTGFENISISPCNLEAFSLENNYVASEVTIYRYAVLSTMEKPAQWDYINSHIQK